MPTPSPQPIFPRTNSAPCSPMPSELAPMLQTRTRELSSLPAPSLPSVIQPKTVEIPLGNQEAIWPGLYVAMQRIPQFSEQPMILVLGGKMKTVVGLL